jgi:hypothetical protein
MTTAKVIELKAAAARSRRETVFDGLNEFLQSHRMARGERSFEDFENKVHEWLMHVETRTARRGDCGSRRRRERARDRGQDAQARAA